MLLGVVSGLAYDRIRIRWRSLIILMLVLILSLFLLESINRLFINDIPLFLWPYRFVTDEATWKIAQSLMPEDPFQAWKQWLLGLLVFLSQFLSVPLNTWLPAWLMPLPTAIGLYGVWIFWRRQGCPPALRRGVIYILTMVLILALMAALARPIFIYTLRFANVGLLGVWMLLLLSFHVLQKRKTVWELTVCTLLVAITILVSSLGEAKRFPVLMNIYRATQVAYASGLNDEAAIAVFPGFILTAMDPLYTRAFVPVWRERSLGVFSSRPYHRFTGDLALPAREIDCEHSLHEIQAHRPVGHTFMLRGQSQAVDGRELRYLVLYAADGRAVGYGIPYMPSSLWQQWRGLGGWQAQWLAGDPMPDAVLAVVYDGERRCKPWAVPLPEALAGN